jgi:uncharacterized repeat protein (TIGR01451 family)
VALGGSATFTVNVTNVGPETATGVELVDAFPAHASVSDVATTLGQCQVEASAVRCDIGTLAPGDSASVTYRVKPRLPGTLANGATLFGAEGDPDLTNNSAFATLEVPVRVDVRPGQHTNVVRVGSRQLIPVAILGQRGFSVRRIDASTLAFGPAGAEAERTSRRGRGKDRDEPCGELVDVNHDGRVDLLAWFRTDRTGIALGDAQACVRGTFLDGRSFTGCDAILTRKDPMCDDEGP